MKSENLERAPTRRLIDEQSAARYLGVSVASLRLNRYQGHRGRRMRLPKPVRLGRRVLYDIRILDEFIDSLLGADLDREGND